MADDLKPNLRAKHVKQLTKTEMCKFFLANKCGKGSQCPFAHNPSELREKPDLNCTSMCRTFLRTGNCDNPSCPFAHCERELRTTGSFFKSKMCRFASSGRCKHGEACRFAHTAAELSPEAAAIETAVGSDTMGAPDATTISDFGGGDSDHPSGGTRGESHRSENARRPDAQGARSTADFGDFPSDQSSSNDGNEPRPATRSNRSAWSDHDQSTRANTTASVMTPRGSGDSGQEETDMMNPSQLISRRVDDRARRSERRNAPTANRQVGRHCTTVMLTNVPQFLTQGSLLSLLEDLSSCMRGSFDFFFCPWNPYEDRNLGYVIINFFSRTVAAEFELQWSNQLLLPRAHGMKRLRVVPAALQGRAANIRHFSGFDLANHSDPRFRPLVRSGPNEVLRPMALARELSQGNQNGNSDPKFNQTPPLRAGQQEQYISRNEQHNFSDQYQQFKFSPELQQQPCLRWSEQQGVTMPPFSNSGLEASDWHSGYGTNSMWQRCGYEDDFDVGSGAETPELENEHPLSRQTSAQAPTALMAMLTALQNRNEGQPLAEHLDAPWRQNTIAHGSAEYFGFDGRRHGGDVQSMYAGGAVDDIPLVVPQGARPNVAWQNRTLNGGTGGCDDITRPRQPYWTLVVPPGAATR